MTQDCMLMDVFSCSKHGCRGKLKKATILPGQVRADGLHLSAVALDESLVRDIRMLLSCHLQAAMITACNLTDPVIWVQSILYTTSLRTTRVCTTHIIRQVIMTAPVDDSVRLQLSI